MNFLLACLIFYVVSALGVYFLLKDAVGVTPDEKSLHLFITFCPGLNTAILIGYLIIVGFYTLSK